MNSYGTYETYGTYGIEFGFWVPLLLFGEKTPVLVFTHYARVLHKEGGGGGDRRYYLLGFCGGGSGLGVAKRGKKLYRSVRVFNDQ